MTLSEEMNQGINIHTHFNTQHLYFTNQYFKLVNTFKFCTFVWHKF